MWIFCCGMPRSGSTVQYQLTKEIVESNGVGQGLGWVEPEEFFNLYKKYDHDKAIKVIKSHRYIPQAKDLIYSNKGKAIHIYRDLRDIVVSIINKDRISFLQFISDNNINSMLQESSSWSNLNNILISKYENMLNNLLEEVKKIAYFLNIDIKESLAIEIANKFSIVNQKRKIQSFDYKLYGKKSGSNIYNPINLLHKNHIYTGEIMQWRNSLSTFQIALIEDLGYKWLIERDYQISQSLIIRKIIKTLYIPLNLLFKFFMSFKNICRKYILLW